MTDETRNYLRRAFFWLLTYIAGIASFAAWYFNQDYVNKHVGTRQIVSAGCLVIAIVAIAAIILADPSRPITIGAVILGVVCGVVAALGLHWSAVGFFVTVIAIVVVLAVLHFGTLEIDFADRIDRFKSRFSS